MSAQAMRNMGDAVKKFLPEDFGFALIVFPFDTPGTSNYVSNAERTSMITALRETADRLEKKQVFPTPKDNIYGSED